MNAFANLGREADTILKAVRERLQQLEGHIQEAKKKLSHMKSGKAVIR